MAETKISTILLGLDGVVVDTDQYYDKFWNQVASDNGLKINNFSSVIKGMTINSIMELYFPLSSREEKQAIRKSCSEIEQSIPYKEVMVPGILDFIKYVKNEGMKIGIVTSSPTSKAGAVINQLSLNGIFDTIITSDSIKKGKPDPMGYVLAQTNLGVQNTECAVFEDSFTGIKAATYAFMRVIGVATLLSEEFLKDYTYGTIPDFKNIEKIKKLLS